MSSKIASLKKVIWLPAVFLSCVLWLTPVALAQQPASAIGPGQNGVAKKSTVPSAEGFHEDYESLTLESSSFRPRKPILVEREELQDGKYVREHFQLGWRPDDTIDLYVIVPKVAKKPPVILYLYSFPENANRFKGDQWYPATVVEGYAAVGFVSAITAERAQRRPPDEWFVGLLPEALASSVHDVQLILDYLSSRGDLDMDRVGMFGTGSGGTIAILASAADPRIKAIDAFDPWGDWPHWMAKSWAIPAKERDIEWNKYLDPKFLEIAAPLDPVQWLPKVKAQSVRIENVRSEATVPLETQKKMEDAAPDRAVIDQFANYQVLMSVQPAASIFTWLRQQLQPDAKPQVAADKSQRVHFFPAQSNGATPIPAQP
jgi:hypothetical protein